MVAASESLTDYELTKPTVFGNGVFVYEPSVFTDAYATSTFAQSTSHDLDAAKTAGTTVPILSFAALGPLRTFSIYVKMTSNGTASDTWELHVVPLVLFDPPTTVATGDFKLYSFGANEGSARTKMFTYTHPNTATTTETELHSGPNREETIIGGGGSFVTVEAVTQMIMMAPYIGLEFKNTGSTDTFTIDVISVWGNFRS